MKTVETRKEHNQWKPKHQSSQEITFFFECRSSLRPEATFAEHKANRRFLARLDFFFDTPAPKFLSQDNPIFRYEIPSLNLVNSSFHSNPLPLSHSPIITEEEEKRRNEETEKLKNRFHNLQSFPTFHLIKIVHRLVHVHCSGSNNTLPFWLKVSCSI